MSRNPLWALVVSIAMLCASAAHSQIAETKHNLSATGPGRYKVSAESEVCLPCHTPHHATSVRALWNRNLASVTYNLYTSSTLEATLDQPTGSSRFCLSCHDGTTALSNQRVSSASPLFVGPLTGPALQGTDLSDDHPISFVYNTTLASKRGELALPAAVTKMLPLDVTGQMQCTTCHDPHDGRYRMFLRRDDRGAALCSTCHILKNWTGSTHATSSATWQGIGSNPWPDSPYTTVADNGCDNCHRPHAAPRPPRLLSNVQERGVCLACHAGTVARDNLQLELFKSSAHPVTSSDWIHDPRENPSVMARHATCTDCHNPHQTQPTITSPPTVPGPLQGTAGVDLSGVSVKKVTYEYEVCLKCHGIRDQNTIGIVRQDNTRNVRMEINPGNLSYHPIAAIGRNPNVAGLEAGYSSASIIGCTDCHNNDEWTLSGSRPRGPHGSRYAPILEREYRTNDPSAESFQSYGLCYKCHNRSSLLSDAAHTFPHRKHVVESQSTCAACHDAHGSRQNGSLINFMLFDQLGTAVVSRSQQQSRLEYVSLGPGRGQCFLQCHGVNHEPEDYP